CPASSTRHHPSSNPSRYRVRLGAVPVRCKLEEVVVSKLRRSLHNENDRHSIADQPERLWGSPLSNRLAALCPGAAHWGFAQCLREQQKRTKRRQQTFRARW